MENILSQEMLQKSLVYWKKRLGLEDWRIVVGIKRKGDMRLGQCKGENTWNYCSRESWIHLLDHEDWPVDTEFEHDMEKTLVHELLHLKFDLLVDEEGGDLTKSQHQLLDDMAKSLVGAYRDGAGWR